MLIHDLDNSGTHDAISQFLRDQEKNLPARLKKDQLSAHPEISQWREAYSWMKAKPKKYKCSVEALLRRVLDQQELPLINPIVDLYNAISIKHVLPVGGDNLDKVNGDISLAIAAGSENFKPIGAEDLEHPKENEVVYKDSEDVLCRRWNWRECDKTKLTRECKNIVIYFESLNGKDTVATALIELQEKIKEFFNLDASYYILDKEQNGFDFDTKELIKNSEKIDDVVIQKETPASKDNKKKDKKADTDKQTMQTKKEAKDSAKQLHWADKIALEVKDRIDRDPQLKEIYEKQGILVYDEKTPSGSIHVGSGRGWVIHDVIAKALREIGMNAVFILSSDDMDPYDKPNKELDSSWDKYLGMPFKDIPSPVEGYKSFGDYYFCQVTEAFKKIGIECELESTGEEYEKGSFNEMIKFILDNAPQVQETYTALYNDTPASHKLPFNVKCPQCGKISTTLASSWDKAKELITFECKKDMFAYVKKDKKTLAIIGSFAPGCGYQGEISPYNGNGKFPWKVEWPAKWKAKNVIVEYAGKDHFSDGGSRTFGCKLITDVIKFPSPYPSKGYSTGKGYEFFNVGGRKMSTSKGKGMSFRQATEKFPPNVLRFLLIKSRLNAVIDFDPSNDNDIFLLSDRFDKAERIYFGETEGIKESEIVSNKRIYELSAVQIPEKLPIQIPLNFSAIVLQVALFDKIKAIEILQNLGHIPKDVSEADLLPVKERLAFAEVWLNEFAYDESREDVSEKNKTKKQEESQYKFQLVTEPKYQPAENEKTALLKLAELLEQNQYDEKSLFNEFYNICTENDIKNTDFFKAAYMSLINKEKGPKLAPFMLTIGQKKVAAILKML